MSCVCGSISNVSDGSSVAGARYRTSTSVPTGAKSRHHSSGPKRVLILGTGSSGKTTIFRQIASQHWTNRDLSSMNAVIHGHVIVTVKKLVEGAHNLYLSHPVLRTGIDAQSSVGRSCSYVINKLHFEDSIDEVAARHIRRIWADPSIQRAFDLRSKYDLRISDSAKYFLDRIDQLGTRGYVPTSMDVLHCSVRSTGITESLVDISGLPYQFLDLGGQRSQRRKWIKCFHNIAAIVYVAAVNEFDEVCEEDGKTNRIRESLAVFEELVNSHACMDIPVILVLNKVDLLEEKLKTQRMSDYFPKFTGGSDSGRGISFFKQMYLRRVERSLQDRITVVSCVSTNRAATISSIKTIRDVIGSATTRPVTVHSGMNPAGYQQTRL